MSLSELLLLIIVIAGAAYAGYMFGRWSVLSGRVSLDASPRSEPEHDPLPGPRETLEPPRRSAAAPPAAAGVSETAATHPGAGRPAPSRTAAPPPARAGLLDTGISTSDAGPKSKPPAGKSSKGRG